MLDQYDVDRGVKLKKSDITPNSYNPNKTSERQQQAINESLNKYGQLLEIVVRPDPNNKGKYLIVDGEHRYHELDDEVYCNVVHGLSDADAKKLTIIFNETRGQADKVELSQLLASLSGDLDDLIVGLPYEESELDELINIAGVDWEDDFDEPDYSVLSDQTEDESLIDGVRKAIQVEFTLDDYKEAYDLLQFWRKEIDYVGGMILNYLKQEKENL